MKVYLVTMGDYGSFAVVAVFSTEELARAYIDGRADPDWFDVVEWEVDK